MVVACDNCGAKYQIEESKIQGRGARITCRKCSHVFAVYLQGQEEEPEVSDNTETDLKAAEDLDVHGLDFKSVGIQSWKVKIKIGLIYDFSDYKTLTKYIREGKVSNTDLLSHDGESWTPLDEIEDLERHFCLVYIQKQRQSEETEPEAPEEAPQTAKTMSGASLTDLASVIAEAEAEVQGREPHNPFAVENKSTPKRRRAPRPPKEEKKSNIGIFAVIGVVVAGLIFWQMKPETNSPPADEVLSQKESQQTKAKVKKPKESPEDVQAREKLQKELEKDAEKLKMELGYSEKDEKKKEDAEPQLIAKIPDAVLEARRNKDNKPVAEKSKEIDHVKAGNDALKQQDWDGAISAFSKAVKKTPTAKVYRGWGIALFKTKRFAAAKAHLNKALKAGLKDCNKWLGFIANEEGDLAGANQHFNDYLKTNPKDAEEIKKVMNGG